MESLKQFIQKKKKSDFSDFLLQLMKERDLTPPILYQRILMDRKLFSKIISIKNYKPTKKTVCALALGLKLDAYTSKQFIKRAGYILTSGSKFDLAIRYCIDHQIYDMNQVELLLQEQGLSLLKP